MSTFELSGPAMTSQSGASSAQRAAERFGATTTTGVSVCLRIEAAHDLLAERVPEVQRAHDGVGLFDQRAVSRGRQGAPGREKPPCGPGHHVMR